MSTIVVDHRLTDPAPTAVGDRTALAFEDFYAANERRLFRALFVLTGDRPEAEDLMQTAFCKVWERWGRVSQFDDPVGYLFRTAFNTHHSTTRRAARAARRLVDRSSHRPPPLEPSELAEVRDRAARALDVLTPRQREAVVLTALLGFDGVEAAGVMGIRPATVRVLVSQARLALADVREDEA
ncbi:MAG TPA: sigma-70 family RNA polymerase sigma factor [Acidimicrobiales bacterium]